MTRPILRWFFPLYVALALSVFSLHAGAQQNLQSIQIIKAAPDLQADPIISAPTIQRRGHDGAPRASASPFSGKATPNAAVSHGLRYPGDLQYHGGPVVDSATNHALFINPSPACPPNACWGDPMGFLSDLSRSDFIHVTDQYVSDHSSDRYPLGASFFAPGYVPSAGAGKPFTNLDLAIAAYSLASATGGFGYNHMYHVFLVPGQDVCFDSTFTVCYSPDNSDTWFFCAYHGSVHDSAGNLVLYTVEPFQDVPGCSVRPDGPNGQLADSTNNTLSHETFETITDPRGNAWWNQLNRALNGEEIGDECAFLLFTPNEVFWDPSVVRLNHKLYATQPEYDNRQHACSTSPED